MKAIGGFIRNKKIEVGGDLDNETIFYILRDIIRIKFGEVGSLNIKPDFYKEGVIYLKIGNSNWANEIWLNKDLIINEMNKKIGEDEINDIKLK